jgi:hypothetical protein
MKRIDHTDIPEHLVSFEIFCEEIAAFPYLRSGND